MIQPILCHCSDEDMITSSAEEQAEYKPYPNWKKHSPGLKKKWKKPPGP
jgi:hypothetical protein